MGNIIYIWTSVDYPCRFVWGQIWPWWQVVMNGRGEIQASHLYNTHTTSEPVLTIPAGLGSDLTPWCSLSISHRLNSWKPKVLVWETCWRHGTAQTSWSDPDVLLSTTIMDCRSWQVLCIKKRTSWQIGCQPRSFIIALLVQYLIVQSLAISHAISDDVELHISWS